MDNAVQYKGFDIIMSVELDDDAKTRFKVAGQIQAVENPTRALRTWISIKDFPSKREAYEDGLQNARA